MPSTWDYNDCRRHTNCVNRGHDLRRVGETDYFNCKCGASARVVGDRIELDHGVPKSLEEKKAENERRKLAHLAQGHSQAR